MPAIKCPYCGHRNFQITGKCTNCGTPLAPQTPTGSSAPLAVYEPPLPPAIPPSRQQTEEIMAVEPYSSRSLSPAAPPASMYPAANNNTSLDPYRSQDFVETIVTGDKRQLAPQSATMGSIPWWFPRRAPDVTGQVIQVQSQEETLHSFDILATIIKTLRDMIWMDLHDNSHHKEQEKIFVTRVRIRTNVGAQRDASLQGHFTGGNISLGDTVSLWGTRRRRILIVRRAFNHTSDSIVTTRAMASALPFLLVLAFLLVALVAFMAWHHIALPIPFILHLLQKR